MLKKCLLLLPVMCLLLCSCASKSQTETPDSDIVVEPQEAEEVFELHNIAIPDADEALGELLPENGERYILFYKLESGRLYRITEIFQEAGNYDECCYYLQVLRAPYTTWEGYSIDLPEEVVDPNCIIWNCYVAADGTIKLLLSDDNNDYVGTWSEQDGISVKKVLLDQRLQDIIVGQTPMYFRWYDSKKEGLFLISEDDMIKYQEGVQSNTALCKTKGLILQMLENAFSNDLYFIGVNSDAWSKENGLVTIQNGEWDIWTKTGEVIYSSKASTTDDQSDDNFFVNDTADVTFYSDTEGYLCNQIGIYQFSTKNNNHHQLLNFEEAGMATEMRRPIQNMSVSVREDGTLLVMCDYYEGKDWLAELVPAGAAVDTKKQLEIAVVSADSFLKKTVVDYNKQSTEFEIVLRECPAGDDPDDYRNKIQAELSAGKGPDLMSSSVLNLRAGSDKGYLLELTEYYNQYKDDFFGAARQLGKVDESYYGIPYAFNVMTLVGSKDLLGNRTEWNMDDAMQCMEQSSAETFIAQADAGYLYYYLGLFTENPKLIDWENRVSYLNGDDGCSLLEFSKQYAKKESQQGEADLERVANGKSLTSIQYLLTPTMSAYVSDSLQGKEIYIGFPAEKGMSGHCLNGEVLEINHNCKEVEGALSFIKYLLSDEQQMYLAEQMDMGAVGYGYPVINRYTEQLFDNLREEAKNHEQADINSEEPVLTAEQIDVLWNVINSACLYDDETEAVWNILLEEIGVYQENTKTTKQIMDVVNNRVQLYLDENG